MVIPAPVTPCSSRASSSDRGLANRQLSPRLPTSGKLMLDVDHVDARPPPEMQGAAPPHGVGQRVREE
jgi:hypothetical protein